MKKLILIALLVAYSLTAKDYTTVNLNIKYKGKIYKNYKCKIVKMVENRAQIITTANRVIWVQVGNSSIQTALDGLKDSNQKRAIAAELRALPQEYISRYEMIQNLSPNGCIVKMFYNAKVGKSWNAYHKKMQEVWGTKTKDVYLIDNFDIADGDIIWHAKGSSEKTVPFYKKGLYKYTTVLGGTRTIEKYSLNP